MRSRSLLLAVFCLLAGAAFGQQQDDGQWYLDKPIREFVFTGLSSINAAELRPIVRPYIGKPFTIDLYEEIREKLYALDYFELIEGTARAGDEQRSTVLVELELKERPVVGSVEVRGNAKVATTSILDKILVKKGDMTTQALVDVDAESIRSLYLEKGYTKVEVKGIQDLDEAENRVSVAFEIVEGPQTKIRDVLFSGNTFASESTLRRLMKTKKQSLLSSGDFQESVFEEDKAAILDYYGKNGFVDATIAKVDQALVEDLANGRVNLDITIYIEEGQQLLLGGVEFQGNELHSTEELEDLMRLSTGKPVNTEQLKTAVQRIADLYYRDGYLETGFAQEERRDTENGTVTYVIHVAESDRVHIENIVISGNTKTQDYVILRELPFEEGDVYSTAKLRQGILNLQNLQYFSSVQPQYPPGSTRGLRDLVITVEEQSTAAFNFGVQFGGGTNPISGKIGWSETNFLGRGLTIGVDAELSNIKQALTANFQEPYLFGLRWSGGVNLSASHERVSNVPQDVLAPVFSDADYENDIAVPDPYDGHYVNADTGEPFDWSTVTLPTTASELQQIIEDNNLVTDYQYAKYVIPPEYAMAYDKYALSAGLRSGVRIPTQLGVFRIDPYLSSSLDYKSYDAAVFRPYKKEDRQGLDTWLIVNSIGVSLAWDKRDYYINPQTGYYVGESFSSVGGVLLGWKHYLKTTTVAEGYITLVSSPVSDSYTFKIVLGAHSSLSFIGPQYHYDAGSGGWLWSAVTESTDEPYIDGMTTARGWRGIAPGKAVWETQLELKLPLSEQLLWWSFFFDVAGVWSTPADFALMQLSDFYFSFGAGFRFTHPQFPIRLYLTKGFRIDNGVQWKTGDLDLGPFSIDFVVSLGGLAF